MTRWKGHEQMKEAERNERKALPPRHKNDFAAMQLETILRKHCNMIKSTMHIWGESNGFWHGVSSRYACNYYMVST